MATQSNTLAWKIQWMEEPGRLQSMGSRWVGHDWVIHFHFSLSCIGEGNGNPLLNSCLENPRDGGAWWAAIYGVVRVGHDWSDLPAAAAASQLSYYGQESLRRNGVAIIVNKRVWSTEWSRAKANRVLPRERTGHSKHVLPTTQEKTLHMDITRWSTLTSDWLYSLQQRWRSFIQSAKTRPGANCGSDHELLIAKFRLRLKKVGKTTRQFRYDLNQIPYDYTVEVRNRFKGLDLIDRVPDELWMEVRDIVEETGIKTIPMEKKCKKAKWLSGEALQIAVKRREVKSKGEK